MSQTRLLFSLLLALALGCGQVSDSPDGAPAGSDHRADGSDPDDGGDAGLPASATDGAPVECDGPEDCAALDGECTAGVCQDGVCVQQAAHQAEPCGDGVLDCGAFSTCAGFADACDESGVQSRSCTDSTCQAGVCVRGAAYTDTRTCQRDTDGDTCAASTTTCGACSYDSTCDRTAADVSCTRTDHTCASGSCGSTLVSAPNQSCDRDTECRSCLTIPGGQPGSCSANGTCGAQCQ
jgi:hypothetical protein